MLDSLLIAFCVASCVLAFISFTLLTTWMSIHLLKSIKQVIREFNNA